MPTTAAREATPAITDGVRSGGQPLPPLQNPTDTLYEANLESIVEHVARFLAASHSIIVW